jgi:galactokinase
MGVTLFSPGRLCLFGEHSDWAAELGDWAGRCLVVGTDQGIFARAEKASPFSVRSLPHHPAPLTVPWRKAQLAQAAGDRNEFFRYCAAVAHEMHGWPGVSGGIDLTITRMDLPLKKGVASSAAVCLLVARAFNEVYGLALGVDELMNIAYRAERFTGSHCGRMDQACIYGSTPVSLTFDRSGACDVVPLTIGRPIHLVFVDLAGQKDTVRILRDLRQAYRCCEDLRCALGPINQAMVADAITALEAGDAESLGAMMIAAQRQFDSLLAPHSKGLVAPRLHHLLASSLIAPHVFGGKGVGSGGDGTAQFVARSRGDQEMLMGRIAKGYPTMQAFPLTIHASRG